MKELFIEFPRLHKNAMRNQ